MIWLMYYMKMTQHNYYITILSNIFLTNFTDYIFSSYLKSNYLISPPNKLVHIISLFTLFLCIQPINQSIQFLYSHQQPNFMHSLFILLYFLTWYSITFLFQLTPLIFYSFSILSIIFDKNQFISQKIQLICAECNYF